MDVFTARHCSMLWWASQATHMVTGEKMLQCYMRCGDSSSIQALWAPRWGRVKARNTRMDPNVPPSPHTPQPCCTGDFKIGTPAALPVPGISRSALGVVGLVHCDWVRKFDLQLLSQCGSRYSCLSRSVTEIHQHVAGTLINQPTILPTLEHLGCLVVRCPSWEKHAGGTIPPPNHPHSVMLHEWLIDWFSCCPAKCRALAGQHWEWLAWYIVIGWERKFDLQPLSRCGSRYSCLSRWVPEIHQHVAETLLNQQFYWPWAALVARWWGVRLTSSTHRDRSPPSLTQSDLGGLVVRCPSCQ